MRSNRRRATGANQSPWSSSTSSSFKANVACANRSALADVSVAVIRCAYLLACSAWTPLPVPRSSTLSTGRRLVARTRLSEACPTPSTWSGAAGLPACSGSRSDTTHQLLSSSPCGRMSKPARSPSPSAPRTMPVASASSSDSGANAALTASRGSVSPRRKSRISTPREPASSSPDVRVPAHPGRVRREPVDPGGRPRRRCRSGRCGTPPAVGSRRRSRTRAAHRSRLVIVARRPRRVAAVPGGAWKFLDPPGVTSFSAVRPWTAEVER